MQFSDTNHLFETRTLLVRADHQQAECWTAFQDTLEIGARVERPSLPEHDHRGAFVDTDHGGSMSATEKHHDEAGREYVALVAKTICEQIKIHDTSHLWLIMDAELLHLVRKELPQTVQAHITRSLPRDLMQVDMTTVVERGWDEATKEA